MTDWLRATALLLTLTVPGGQLSAEPLAPGAGVDALLESTAVLRAIEFLDERRALTNRQMVELNEIPAPPFGEHARALELQRYLEAAGLEVRQDSAGNVIGRRPGALGARSVALIAHLDTVFPKDTDVRVRRDGNVYRAPGIGDNARGLAMMLSIADAMRAARLETTDDVLFIGTVGEEGLGDLRGVRHLFSDADDAPSIDAAIAIDGGPIERIVATAVGSERYRVTFMGAGGHSYGDFGQANPHHALADAIARFIDAAQPIADAEGAKATYSVGRIGGGTSINSIAFESWMEVDMRSSDPVRLAALDHAFRSAVDDALLQENGRRRGGEALRVEIEPVGSRPAGSTAEDSALVQRALRGLAAVGIDGVLSASSTDANVPMSLGIPAITVSRGGVSQHAHSLNEQWEDVNTSLAERALLLTVLAESGALSGPVAAD